MSGTVSYTHLDVYKRQVEQINIRLTLIQSSERFGDGNVAAEIENGNLLKMLLRLDDLLNKSVKN